VIKLGRINDLPVTEIGEQEIVLQDRRHRFAIAKKQVPDVNQVGDKVRGFVYSDRDGNFKFTLLRPYALLGEFAHLYIRNTTSMGAFADWGIESDLFIPSKESDGPLDSGRHYTVFVKMDTRNKQIVGTTKYLDFVVAADDGIKNHDIAGYLITGRHELGYRAVINHRYRGMIYKDQTVGPVAIGQRGEGRVMLVRRDGAIDISLYRSPQLQQRAAEKVILEALNKNKGFLPINDKTIPQLIEYKLGMSKKLFKKALGGLYRLRKISINDDGIRLQKPSKRGQIV
jgi:predicted RNA-binding protein (virulence factor B family)